MKWLRYLLAPSDWFSPGYFLSRALVIGVAYLIFTVAGLGDYTTFISGTVEGASATGSALLGLLYLMTYFAFVLLAPILVIAAGLLALTRRSQRMSQSANH